MSSGAGRDSDKFQLRLPDGMRDRIKIAAEVNGRSMNAEIVNRLELSFEGDSDADYMERVIQRMQRERIEQDREIYQLRELLLEIRGMLAHQQDVPTLTVSQDVEDTEGR